MAKSGPAAGRRARPRPAVSAGPDRLRAGIRARRGARRVRERPGPSVARIGQDLDPRGPQRSLAPTSSSTSSGWGFALYTELASIALEAGPPYEPDQLVSGSGTSRPTSSGGDCSGAESPPNRAMVSDGAFDRALAGDRGSRGASRGRSASTRRRGAPSIGCCRAGRGRSRTRSPRSLRPGQRPGLSDVCRQRTCELIARDVDGKERLFASLPGRRGASHGDQRHRSRSDGRGQRRSSLIPTVALRPFIAPGEFGSTLIVLSSVADEAFEADASTPPRRLVKMAAAIGDELRLRILHELAGERVDRPAIAGRLGVERTSLHHHLGILRSAGLLTMHDAGTPGLAVQPPGCWPGGRRERACRVPRPGRLSRRARGLTCNFYDQDMCPAKGSGPNPETITNYIKETYPETVVPRRTVHVLLARREALAELRHDRDDGRARRGAIQSRAARRLPTQHRRRSADVQAAGRLDQSSRTTPNRPAAPPPRLRQAALDLDPQPERRNVP